VDALGEDEVSGVAAPPVGLTFTDAGGSFVVPEPQAARNTTSDKAVPVLNLTAAS
jgi:hypothetical protein